MAAEPAPDLVVVKIGGRAATDEAQLALMVAEIASLRAGRRFILVHGGGAEVTALSKRLGFEPVFRDGVRQTSPEEMDVVEMVLAGRMNKHLVRTLLSAGLDAVGLSGSDGGIFASHPVAPDSRTGEVSAVNRRLLDHLLAGGYLPVICSTSFDSGWRGMNVNADSVALALASTMKAGALVFLSDVAGVLADKEVVRELDAALAQRLTASGALNGGMIPKVTASLGAVADGVGAVIIGMYDGPGSLGRLLAGASGTRIRN